MGPCLNNISISDPEQIRLVYILSAHEVLSPVSGGLTCLAFQFTDLETRRGKVSHELEAGVCLSTASMQKPGDHSFPLEIVLSGHGTGRVRRAAAHCP